ncbi:MAG: hypothetical protein RIR65_2426 [Planctomycetota bacterium]|jgi:hypothetical protein
MNHGSWSLFAIVMALAPACRSTASNQGQATVDARVATAVFERLKALEGDWSGTATMGDESFAVETRWRSTGGGSAVVETLFVGTPHEMVTMYHLDGPRLMLTHYCAARNQPRMVASAATAPADAGFEASFTFLDCTNLESPGAMHMHDAWMAMDASGVLRSRWTAWLAGKPDHDAAFELRRK